MKRTVCHILFTILICLVPGKSYCQKTCNNNFTSLAKAYLEHATQKYKLDTIATVFIASIDYSENGDFFYGLIFIDTTFLTNFKYDAIYALGNFKLIVPKELDTAGRLTNVFKKRPFEELNKGEKIPKRYRSEGFHSWSFLMNKRCEIMQVNGQQPTKKYMKKYKQDMKKYKLIFAKSPY